MSFDTNSFASDGIILADRALTRRAFLAGALGLGATALLAGCGTGSSSSSSGSGSTITVGSKDFTENLILAELYALALEDKGFKVKRKFNISSSVTHTSLVNGDIDLYPEYTGTALISILKKDVETDPKKVYQTVKAAYKKKWNIDWLEYAKATDSQGLVITTAASKKYGITTITDLQKNASKLRFASQGEFDKREDGIPALEKAYGKFDWKSSKVYDNSLKYEILRKGQADVTPAYTTEGQIASKTFTLLEDDKHVWPPYNVAPVVRGKVLKANPKIEDALNAVSKTLTTAGLTKLNAQVDVKKKEYEDVAAAYFKKIK